MSLRGQVSGVPSTTAPITLTLPATTTVGDFLVLIQSNDYYTMAALAAPSGTAVTTWTERTDARIDGGTGSGGVAIPHVKVWTGPVTTGGSSTVIANWAAPSGGDEERYAQALVFTSEHSYGSGVTVATSSSTTWTSSSVTASTASSYLVVMAMALNGAFNLTFPGSMTAGTEGDVAGFLSARTGWELLAAAGATGTRSITVSPAGAGSITSLVVESSAAAGVTKVPDHTRSRARINRSYFW